ncbi:DUF58 domain-containing protein [Salinactinospora qingdaonensis]|uniref:DUF58 domain-containing protein n=1 Tax=Salinactinospora qingdaonensis TaxID=702744 RepID=A0ABP7FLL9_9ACTN
MILVRLLGAFTLRGYLFLLAGAAIVTGALIVGERDLMRIGVFVVVLPVLSMLTALRAPRTVTHTRTLEPVRVVAGTEARVRIHLTNTAKLLPATGVLAEDALPYTFGEAPRFGIGRLRAGETRELSYRLRSQMRGRYPIGPLTLRFRDPLGCVHLSRSVGPSMSLLVTPAMIALPGSVPRGASADSGASRSRVMASAGEDDIVPRAYQQGDDIRRVHWRTTARRGELMVRREEQQWREHTSLLLDTRRNAHTGAGPGSSLEVSVSAAASIAVHLLAQGQELRFVTNEAEITAARSRDGVLDALATTTSSSSADLRRGISLLNNVAASGRGLLVAVVGALSSTEVAALADYAGGSGRSCVAVLCADAAWDSPERARQTQEYLTGTGWRVIMLNRLDELPEGWRQLLSSTGLAHG